MQEAHHIIKINLRYLLHIPKSMAIKSKEIKRLEDEAWALKRQTKTVKYHAETRDISEADLKYEFGKSCKFTVKDTNSLTRAIEALCFVIGGLGCRINSTGIFDEKTGKWRKSNSKRGIGDINVCLNGANIWIEVKWGKDKQSEEQKKFQRQLERAGGLYLIAKDFESIDQKLRALADLQTTFDLHPGK